VLTLVCVACGKPCRSATEKELHTTRTGHNEFADKTDEQVSVDTEAQMKELKQEIKDEDGEGAGPSAMETDTVEMVPVEVDATLLSELGEMGFEANRATRALYATGTSSIEQAVNWIVEHEGDADLDLPLLVPKGGAPKPKLSKEEAKQQAAELLRKAKLKREKEEREAEKLREQERVRSGKELAEAKRKEDEQERKRILEWRKREKAEEAKAKARIQEKLEEDRKARRLAQGLPEEYTEEELRVRAEKEAKKAEEAKAKAAAAENRPKPKPVTLQNELRALLVKMKQSHMEENDRVTKGFNTLLTYLGNIMRNPAEEKFRKINLGNAAFQARLGSLEGGIDFLMKCGFKKDAAGEFLLMAPDDVAAEVLNAAGSEINTALTNPFFGVL